MKSLYLVQNGILGIPVIGARIRAISFVAILLLCFSADCLAQSNFDLPNLIKKGHDNARKNRIVWREMGMETRSSGQTPDRLIANQAQTVVFISRSMPEPFLINLLNQGAGRSDIVFVYRGWGNGGVDHMFNYAAKLHKKLSITAQKYPPTIMVYPAAFDVYHITHVPAVLHHHHDDKWYLIQGALSSLDDTVEQIRLKRFDRSLSPQWRVAEPDQALVLQKRAKKLDWQLLRQKANDEIRRQIKGTLDLPYADSNTKSLWTPYYTAPNDIINPKTRRVVYPKGTRFNLLALDPTGKRSLLVIDGYDKWQVAFARKVRAKMPHTIILYTRLGTLQGTHIPAYAIDRTTAKRLSIQSVPTLMIQKGMQFEIHTFKRR